MIATLDLQVVNFVATCNLLQLDYDPVCHCAVLRQPELMNSTEMKQNDSEVLAFSGKNDLEPHEVLCAPPVTNQMWQMASGYIGAVLMLAMAVYGRYDNSCICAVVKAGIHYPTYPCSWPVFTETGLEDMMVCTGVVLGQQNPSSEQRNYQYGRR